MNKIIYIFIASSLIFLLSCNNDNNGLNDISFSWEKIELPENIEINNISFYDNKIGVLCGGRSYSSGSIYVTYDNGKNWNRFFKSDSLSINDIYIINENLIYACGDDLIFLKSTDKGQNWNIEPISDFNFYNFRVPYNSMYFINDKNFFLVGGEYNKGLISEFENNKWIHTAFDRPFNSVCFISDYIGFFGGYNIMLLTEDGGNLFEEIELNGSIVSDLNKDRYNNLYSVFRNGVVSVTSDLGYNWINAIIDRYHKFTSSYFGENISAICGTNGLLYIKYNNGKWLKVKDIPIVDFKSVYINSNNEIFLGTNNGELYLLNKKRIP